jgi:hypothetical protein
LPTDLPKKLPGAKFVAEQSRGETPSLYAGMAKWSCCRQQVRGAGNVITGTDGAFSHLLYFNTLEFTRIAVLKATTPLQWRFS